MICFEGLVSWDKEMKLMNEMMIRKGNGQMHYLHVEALPAYIMFS